MSLRLVVPSVSVVSAAIALAFVSAASAQTYSTAVPSTVTANYTGGAGGSIPDNDNTGITTSININPLGSVLSVNSVTITGFTHTFSGDIAATLNHNGVFVDIIGLGSGDASDFAGNYTFTPSGPSFPAAAGATAGAVPAGTYASAGLLSAFTGTAAAGAWSLNVVDGFAVDTGAYSGWSFNATTQVVNTIPDGTGVSSTDISVADNFTIASLDSVTILGLNHTFLGDLTAQLVHLTTGTTVDLFSRVGATTTGSFGDSSNLNGDYTFTLGGASLIAAAGVGNSSYNIPAGAFAASTSQIPGQANTNTLSSFTGQNVGGTWRLLITDSSSGDSGFYTGWRFGVTAVPSASAAPEPSSLALIPAALGLVLLPKVRRRRQRIEPAGTVKTA